MIKEGRRGNLTDLKAISRIKVAAGRAYGKGWTRRERIRSGNRPLASILNSSALDVKNTCAYFIKGPESRYRINT